MKQNKLGMDGQGLGLGRNWQFYLYEKVTWRYYLYFVIGFWYERDLSFLLSIFLIHFSSKTYFTKNERENSAEAQQFKEDLQNGSSSLYFGLAKNSPKYGKIH